MVTTSSSGVMSFTNPPRVEGVEYGARGLLLSSGSHLLHRIGRTACGVRALGVRVVGSGRWGPSGWSARMRSTAESRPGSAVEARGLVQRMGGCAPPSRSEEHTSELQSRGHLVCRLLLENKNKNMPHNYQDA